MLVALAQRHTARAVHAVMGTRANNKTSICQGQEAAGIHAVPHPRQYVDHTHNSSGMAPAGHWVDLGDKWRHGLTRQD